MARNERQMLLPKARRRLDTGSEVVDIEMHYVIFCCFIARISSKNAPKCSEPFDPFRSVVGISRHS